MKTQYGFSDASTTDVALLLPNQSGQIWDSFAGQFVFFGRQSFKLVEELEDSSVLTMPDSSSDVARAFSELAVSLNHALARDIPRSIRYSETLQLLSTWLTTDSDYDQRTWPNLKKSIEENRLSQRSAFP